MAPYHDDEPNPSPPDDETRATRLRRLRMIRAMEDAGFMTATAFADHYDLSRITVTKCLLGLSDNLDVAAAFREIGFRERRTALGHLAGSKRVWQHRPPVTELGIKHFGHLFSDKCMGAA